MTANKWIYQFLNKNLTYTNVKDDNWCCPFPGLQICGITNLTQWQTASITRSFFISQSTGNDTNPGTINAPWKTLARLQLAGPFKPGDSLNLLAGDVWNETFTMIGTGQYDEALYNTTYTAVLASQTVVYQDGPTFTTFHNKLLTAGYTDPTATSVTDDYCVRLARIDALEAALTAADGSAATNYITLQRYGTGANPKIDRGGTADYGLHADNATFAGGWKILDIDITNCKAAGIDIEVGAVKHAVGVTIDGCSFSGITGIPPLTVRPGCDLICGTPIMVSRCDRVWVKNISIGTNCDLPMFVIASNGYLVENLQAPNPTNYTGMWLSVRLVGTYQVGPSGTDISVNGVVRNSSFTQMGQAGPGLSVGTAGVQFNGGTDIYLVNSTIDATGPGGAVPDNLGVDMEGYGSLNLMLLRVTVKNCLGAGVLVFPTSGSSGAAGKGAMWIDCTWTNNHLTNPTLMRLSGNLLNNIIVVGNTVTRHTPITQFLNFISDGVGPQGNVNTFPARFFVADLTIKN